MKSVIRRPRVYLVGLAFLLPTRLSPSSLLAKLLIATFFITNCAFAEEYYELFPVHPNMDCSNQLAYFLHSDIDQPGARGAILIQNAPHAVPRFFLSVGDPYIRIGSTYMYICPANYLPGTQYWMNQREAYRLIGLGHSQYNLEFVTCGYTGPQLPQGWPRHFRRFVRYGGQTFCAIRR